MDNKTSESPQPVTGAQHPRREASNTIMATVAKFDRNATRERVSYGDRQTKSAAEPLLAEEIQQSLTLPNKPGVKSSITYYEELKANFLRRCSDGSTKTILITGTTNREGASTTASNFAKALAQDPRLKILLIDANLKNPSMHNIFTLDHSTSLTQFLQRTVTGGNPFQFKQGEVQVMPTGGTYSDPASIFESPSFSNFLTEMQETFDYIVLDGPPVFRSAECMLLARKVDATILVIESGKTRKQIALRAIQQIEDAGGKILGIVLNRRKFYIPDWLYKHL
jgi:capsular exopolysaccharide synthesis family protein